MTTLTPDRSPAGAPSSGAGRIEIDRVEKFYTKATKRRSVHEKVHALREVNLTVADG